MPYHQLQLLNIKTMTADSSLTVPKGTPTVAMVRKAARPRGHGVITVDVADEAELVDLACFLVARNQIVQTLNKAWVLTKAEPGWVNLLRNIEAAIFMATGQYVPGCGPDPPIAIDLWRRRNGMVPKYGHLTEAEIRMHVKAMDDHAKRAYDPKEPFESQLRRYVAQLQDDAKHFDAAEARTMGGLIRELDAGYVLDRGEAAHMDVPAEKFRSTPGNAERKMSHALTNNGEAEHLLAPGEKVVDEL